MSRRDRLSPAVGRWSIDGMHPAEYASLWGYGNHGEGALFYNCADYDRRTGQTIANPHWTADDWKRFAQLCRETAAGVAKCRAANPTDFGPNDAPNLQRLAEWGEYMAGRMASANRWNLSGTF